MNRLDDCVSDVVQACGRGDEATALANAQRRIDQFFNDLAAFLKEWPKQDGSREMSDLRDKLTAASESAVRQGATSLSDRLERIVDYVQAKRGR